MLVIYEPLSIFWALYVHKVFLSQDKTTMMMLMMRTSSIMIVRHVFIQDSLLLRQRIVTQDDSVCVCKWGCQRIKKWKHRCNRGAWLPIVSILLNSKSSFQLQMVFIHFSQRLLGSLWALTDKPAIFTLGIAGWCVPSYHFNKPLLTKTLPPPLIGRSWKWQDWCMQTLHVSTQDYGH